MMNNTMIKLLLIALAPMMAVAKVRGSHQPPQQLIDENDEASERELRNYHQPYRIPNQYNPWAYGSKTNVHHPYHRPGGYNTHHAARPRRPVVVPCDHKLTPFTAEVLVDFNGDPSLVTYKDVHFLEESFRRTYNVLSKRLCDDKFRMIHSAKAVHDHGDSPVIQRGGLSFGLRYLVKGVCRGCSPNAYLFSAPTGYVHRALTSNETETISLVNHDERQLWQHHERQLWQPHLQWDQRKPAPTQKKSYDPNYYGERIKQSRHSTKGSKSKGSSSYYYKSKGTKSSKSGSHYSGHSPACTCTSSHPQWRPPTEEGFAKAFNNYILKFALDHGVKRHYDHMIQVVKDVAETNGVPCVKESSGFEAFLEVEFTGTYESLTPWEISMLERNVFAVYNGLSDKQCDLLFRDIDQVTVVFGESFGSTFTLLFLVDAECLGCDEDTTLFGVDGNRRQLVPNHNRPWHPKQRDKECFCPIYDAPYGAPTDSSFEVSYNDAIVQLFNVGYLKHVSNVLQVTEAVDGSTRAPSASPTAPSDGGQAAPTISPSQNPTTSASPSISPSTSPTQAPSNSPSQLPSTTPTFDSGGIPEPPSSSPSESPSTSPSESPTLSASPSTESGMPSSSQSPSISPSLSTTPSTSEAPSSFPSVSESPSTSAMPSESALPSLEPSSSMMPSESFSLSTSSIPSEMPSLSSEPSVEPSLSTQPSTSSELSLEPSVSAQPSTSSEPSTAPSTSPSGAPSKSSEPSVEPTLSTQPSTSSEPSTAPSTSPSAAPSFVRPSSPTAAVSTCPQDECVVYITVDADTIEKHRVATQTIRLNNVSFISNVTVEIAHTYGEDLEIVLVTPTEDEYVLMLDEVAIEGTGDDESADFDLGNVPDDPGLANVASYTFVESDGRAGFTSPHSPPGTYNSNTWLSGPHDAGDWTFKVRDNGEGDPTSIGDAIIRYCGTCVSSAPSSSPSYQPSTMPTVTQDVAVSAATSGGRGRKNKPGPPPTVAQDVAAADGGGRRKRGGNLLRHRG